MPDVREARLPSSDAPLLATALARSFELVAGVALFALERDRGGRRPDPELGHDPGRRSRSSSCSSGSRSSCLALLLSRRSAHAVMQPLEVLDDALAAITSGDLTVRVHLDGAAAEIQFVGESVNTMVVELARLRVVEIERTKDQRVRRELAEVVHASLDLDHVVQRAVEVVGRRARSRSRAHSAARDAMPAGSRRSGVVRTTSPPLRAVSPTDELFALIHLIGITDDGRAVVIDDTFDSQRFRVEQRDAFEEASVRAALSYPIFVGGRVGGVLVASEQRAPRAWTDGEVTLMEGFAREIGRALDHARAFELQNQMVERLVLLDRSKNDFLAEVSRELRGPLASVLGYIELLTDESAGSGLRRAAAHVGDRRAQRRKAARAHLQPVDDVADGSGNVRADAGARRCRRDGSARVRRRSRLRSSQGELDVDVNLEPGLELVADEAQIERALHNLVSNAVKFTPGGWSHRHLDAVGQRPRRHRRARHRYRCRRRRAGRAVLALLQFEDRAAARDARYRSRLCTS